MGIVSILIVLTAKCYRFTDCNPLFCLSVYMNVSCITRHLSICIILIFCFFCYSCIFSLVLCFLTILLFCLSFYLTALRASLRQSPDVILLGEMRDYETTQVAMTAAETGHLLFSTLHTIGAANTIDRIIDVFPPNQQRQIAVQLSMVLQAVVSQQLVPTTDGGITPAFEIMIVNPAIRNMIRDNKIPQIDGLIYSSAGNDLVSMDSSLLSLYKNGRITADTALAYASNPEMLKKKL